MLLPLLQSILVSADVVPVTLDVSDEELVFTFSVDNWDDHVEQVGGRKQAECQAWSPDQALQL